MQHIAHVTVLVLSYEEGVSFFVETLGFELAADWEPDQEVVGWTARISVPAVIMSERETRGVQVVGIDPDVEPTISFLGDAEIDGEMLSTRDDARVLIGRAMAELLSIPSHRRE